MNAGNITLCSFLLGFTITPPHPPQPNCPFAVLTPCRGHSCRYKFFSSTVPRLRLRKRARVNLMQLLCLEVVAVAQSDWNTQASKQKVWPWQLGILGSSQKYDEIIFSVYSAWACFKKLNRLTRPNQWGCSASLLWVQCCSQLIVQYQHHFDLNCRENRFFAFLPFLFASSKTREVLPSEPTDSKGLENALHCSRIAEPTAVEQL